MCAPSYWLERFQNFPEHQRIRLMALIVQKYGGTSVGDVDRIKARIASHLNALDGLLEDEKGGA